MSHIRLTARNTSIGNKSQQAYKYQQNLPTTQVGVWFDTFCRLNMAPNLFSRDAHYRVLKVQPAGQQTSPVRLTWHDKEHRGWAFLLNLSLPVSDIKADWAFPTFLLSLCEMPLL